MWEPIITDYNCEDFLFVLVFFFFFCKNDEICGTRNPGQATVEQAILDAIFKAGGAKEQNYSDPSKVS
jgi:hypothetical protein